jgi:hypothetical protein
VTRPLDPLRCTIWVRDLVDIVDRNQIGRGRAGALPVRRPTVAQAELPPLAQFARRIERATDIDRFVKRAKALPPQYLLGNIEQLRQLNAHVLGETLRFSDLNI